MSIRIKTTEDLGKLGDFAKKQVEAALNKCARPLATTSTDSLYKQKKTSPSPLEQANSGTSKKKKRPARVMKNNEGLRYCPYPNPDPSVALHIALLQEFGSWWDGGELVDEMIIPGHSIQFRYDFCLPHYRLAIEIDGFGYHRDLESFKKDREKQKHALKHGWVVHRLTNSDIRNAFNSIIPDIKTILSYREKHSAELIRTGKIWCSLVL